MPDKDFRRQVLTYTKPAKDLKVGDRILTSRMTVAEIKTLEISDTWKDDQKAVHIWFEHSSGRACFIDHEQVLVLE